jgi:two-component system, cell cycle response regulator
MATLVHAALRLRRTARLSYGYLAAVALAAIVALGEFSRPASELGLLHAIAASIWVVVVLGRLSAHRRAREDAEPAIATQIELGLLALVAAHAALQVAGGLTSPYQPALYLLVALFTSFLDPRSGFSLTTAAIGLDFAIHTHAEGGESLAPWIVRAAFTVVFAAASLAFTRVEIARLRASGQRSLAEERARVQEESRFFRLAAPATRSEGDEERLFHASVEELHHSLYHLLRLLHRTLELHTVTLLMFDESKTKLRMVESVSDSDDLAEGPFVPTEGAVGAALKRGEAMNLRNLKPGYMGLLYYHGPALCRAFVATPVVDRDEIVGVLCADRIVDRPFTEHEEGLLEDATRQLLRALENERVFVQLERSKREQTVLYKASQALGAALDKDAVLEAGLEAAREIVRYDVAAVTSFDPETKKHKVERALGESIASLEGLEFKDNNSLTSMVVKNRHFLPYRGEYDARSQVVFTKRARIEGMSSLLVLPLIVREDSIGTLVLGSREPQKFPEAVRQTLQVLANQLSVSLANAHAVSRLEEMATTDGLTGCLNKRAFLEEMEKRVRSAERFGRKLSLIITDIDHFKSVNDTYGHATGDVVIRELGHVLKRVKRETDIVARFGGEEFCVLCEETDTEGATQLAERARVELGDTVFNTELGELRVALSLGVATFPEHATHPHALFEAADKALYKAKNSGRNQVCVA